MKKIDESAKEYVQSRPYSTLETPKLKDEAYDGFKAGVEFAQRWIPIEENLPEVNSDNGFSVDVIAKSNNTHYIANYNSIGKSWNIKGTSVFYPITHWRPI